MSFLKWLVAGGVGAAVGGVAWVLIGHFANAEVGWIAWGIGFLAGLAVRAVAGDAHGAGPGLAAVATAAAGVAVSKYVVAALMVQQIIAGQAGQAGPNFESDDFAVVLTADEIIETDYVAAGKPVPWPEGVTAETASTPADYPAEIRTKAEQNWAAVPDAEKRTRRDAWKQNYDLSVAEFTDSLRSEAFAASFGLWDLLWFGLAMYTAFQVGSGAGGSKSQVASREPTPDSEEPNRQTVQT